MSVKIQRSILGLLGLFSLLFLTACQQPAQSFERPPAPVTVVEAVSEDVPLYLDAIGKTVAREVVSIEPQVSGRIMQIHFVDGAHVKKGTMLFTIDPRPYEARLHEAQATLAQRKAALDLAKIEFQRVASLIETKAISQSDYDTRKNAVDVAQAQLKQSEADLEMAKLNLNYCFIRSPIEGRAGQRLVDVGNIVSNDSSDSLLVIQRLDPVYADFTIPEHELSVVQTNMQRDTLKVEVHLPDGAAREGKLTFLDNAVQDGTGTVKLRATIPNHDALFWPGRFVNVRLVLGMQQNAVLIPAVAPQMSANGNFVYVVGKDSVAEIRPVKLGQRQGELVVIQEGLQAGESVVTKGQLGVTPGGKVRVGQDTPPGGNDKGEALAKGGAS